MTSFVLKQNYTTTLDISQIDFYDKELSILEKIRNYAKFLKQPLKLEMFVTCDDEGNFFEEPKIEDYFDDGFNFEFNQTHFKDVVLKEYQIAETKVLFEGIEFRKNGGVNFLTIKEDTFAFFDFNVKFKNLTIEDLIQYNLQLTENAVKQIGL